MVKGSGSKEFWLAALLLAFTAFFAWTAEAAEDISLVKTEGGLLRGSVEDGVAAFRGIPYAAPPVGELRFRPPAPPEAWTGVRDAKTFARRAAQNADLGVFAQAGGSEDCLYLSVYAPERAIKEKERLPVFFWIHGGGLNVGSANDYDPGALAKLGGAVVVAVNYRLGIFGFFAHPALLAEDHPQANYGLMDQIFALEWVRRNIPAFGGDPADVTIAGESSGGQSVLALMTSPKARGLFRSAIAMSGCTVTIPSPFRSYEMGAAVKRGVVFAAALGLKEATAADLRSLSAEEILAAQTPYLLGSFVVDGEYVPENIGEAIRAGRVNGDIFVNGTTRREGSFFAGIMENALGRPLTEEDMRRAVEGYRFDVGEGRTEEIMAEYAPEIFGSPAEAFAAVTTDLRFATTAALVNEALCEKIPTYAYEFADDTAPRYIEASFPQGAAHTYELPYLFRGFSGASRLSTKLNDEQERLSDEMIRLFTRASRLREQSLWEPYTREKRGYLRLALPGSRMTYGEFEKAHRVDFWKRIFGERSQDNLS